MVLKFDSFDGIDTCKLRDVYEEACRINAVIFYPHVNDGNEAVKMAWEDYLTFLLERFFIREGDRYFILEEDERYLSAVRSRKEKDGIIFLEALETAPKERNKGFAERLLKEVKNYYLKENFTALTDLVLKSNLSSLRCHEKCGFVIEDEKDEKYYKLKCALKK